VIVDVVVSVDGDGDVAVGDLRRRWSVNGHVTRRRRRQRQRQRQRRRQRLPQAPTVALFDELWR
jgi:hypothetical protein